MANPLYIDSIDAAVDHVLDSISGDIVLGIPLGVGKPNPFVNALYRRIKMNPARKLRIITALSLEKPVGHSDLERHFLEPLVERVFADYPDLEYVKDSRSGALPPNIEVREFFMKTGDYLGNSAAQLGYISTNYTFVARDMLGQGLNVIAQAVAEREQDGERQISLSSNPDVVQEVVERYAEAGKPLLCIGVVNRQMPFMLGGALVPPSFFDILCDDPAATHTLFAPPNAKVSTADYAIGLHASSLVVDGGTLQIGIGSLGDAIGHALILRDRQGADYRRILESLCPDGLQGRELAPFQQGLYGCSEMFVNAFLALMDAGIIRREVYADATLQTLVNEGRLDPAQLPANVLELLAEEGCINLPPTAKDQAWLRRFGILDAEGRPGQRLRGGVCMTGGFFIGPGAFYEALRRLPEPERARIDMTRIDFINQLYGKSAEETQLKREQRRKARFMNTTMKVTLLGAAASDALESGAVVSGVGGQYNFVAMAHALPDARLIMMLRATHDNKNGLKSSIVWNYGHVTIPRHLRDIVVTEYGVADLLGQSDSEVIKRLIAVADSRFQDELVKEAKAHGKLDAHYEIPERYRRNLPNVLADTLQPWAEAELLPDFPFGTDLTPDELKIVRALKKLKHASEHPAELLSLAFKSIWEGKEAPQAYLERLGLADVHSFKDAVTRRLFAGNL